MYSGRLTPRQIVKKTCDLCETEDRVSNSRLCEKCRDKWLEYDHKYRRLHTDKPTHEIFEKWLEKMRNWKGRETFVFR